MCKYLLTILPATFFQPKLSMQIGGTRLSYLQKKRLNSGVQELVCIVRAQDIGLLQV